MSFNSKLATTLGAPLGGSATIAVTALSAAECSGSCTATVALVVSGVSLTLARGQATTTTAIRESLLGQQLAFQLGGRVPPVIATPNSVLGAAKTSGQAVVKLVVTAFGAVKTSGSAPGSLHLLALGVTVTSGAINVNVRLQGATSIATTSGKAVGKLSVIALGIVHASGSMTATAIVAVNARGLVKTSGSIPNATLSVPAVGVVQTLGSCTIPLAAGTVPCVTGPNNPATLSPGNAVY